ncbi:MAG: autotransporter-associated beta strand repeat-containing protein, partial [Terrimicrobiaceae bacterium]
GFPDLLFLGSRQTINNGTFKILGEGGATDTTPMNVGFYAVTTFNNADLLIGANATTIFGVANAFGTTSGSLPGVTVEANGALNLSATAGASATSQDLTIASLAGAGNVVNSAGVAGTATLTINGSATTTFSGTIKDGGYNGRTAGLVALTKEGSGTQTLSGTNTYTGATTVSAGTLLLSSTGSIAAGSAVTVQTGAAIGGDGTISGNLTLASGAKFVFDLNDNPLTVGGTFALDSTFGVDDLVTSSLGVIDWSTVTVGTYTLIGTSFVFNSGNIENFGLVNAYSSGGKQMYFANGSLDLVVVPEPATWLLLAGSLTVLMASRRRRRS